MKILKGTLLLNRGDLDGAEQLSRQSLEVASKRGFKKYVGRAERLLGIILTKRTAYNQAEARFKSAQGRLEEVENPKQLWITHAELARLYKKMNRSDLEREQWQKAAQIVTKTSDELQDNDLKETFISAPPIRQIIAGAKP
jgi:tetratricopeptide (TPR) repeat protein